MTSISKSKIFIGIAISFALGILIASAFDISRWDVYIFLAVAAAAFALMFFGQNQKSAIAALFLFCAGLGVLRLQVSMVENQFQELFDSKQQLEGYVTEDVDVRAASQLITFQPKGYSQNILISARLGQKFFYGDWIVAEGKPQAAQNYGDFDYQKYLERFNVYATMDYPKILMLKSDQLNPVKGLLLKVKAAFLARMSRFLDEPQNSLAVGILIGGHGTLPKDIVNNFSVTGISHIIAVSGFNITIIILAITSLAQIIGRKNSVWLAAFAIVAFVIICGASASVVRAAIMGSLLLISLSLGRQYSVAPALFFAALVMLAVNPKILFWDVGFQLSFAATLGIIYFMPVLGKLAQNLPEDFGLKTLILTTLSAILATMPLIILNFGIISLSAPIVNMLVVPAVPWSMLFGFLTALPFVGSGSALVANWILLYILKVVSVFAGLPYSSLNAQIGPWIFWLLVLAVLGLYYLLALLAKDRPVEENSQP